MNRGRPEASTRPPLVPWGLRLHGGVDETNATIAAGEQKERRRARGGEDRQHKTIRARSGELRSSHYEPANRKVIRVSSRCAFDGSGRKCRREEALPFPEAGYEARKRRCLVVRMMMMGNDDDHGQDGCEGDVNRFRYTDEAGFELGKRNGRRGKRAGGGTEMPGHKPTIGSRLTLTRFLGGQ